MVDNFESQHSIPLTQVWKAENERKRRKEVVAMAGRGERVKPDFSDINRVTKEELYGPSPTINRKLPLPNVLPKPTAIIVDSNPDLSTAADK